MATVYRFWHSHDSLQLVHDGTTLITGEGDNAVVQQFPSEGAAREHLDRILMQRRRSGYRIDAREEALAPGQVELAEIADLVEWDEPARRLSVTFDGQTEARALSPAVIAAAAAKRPICLGVACDPGSPGPAFAAALLASPLPSIKRFIFDTNHQPLARQRDNSIGDLADVFAGLPKLESAFLSGELLLRPCTHATLRELWLLGDPLLPSAMSALGRCRFPALGRLGLALCHESGDAPDKPAARALQTLVAPNLRTVDIAGATDIPALLDLLADGSLPGRWTDLYIAGTIGDEDALLATLERHRDVLARLKSLALPLSDELSHEADEKARRLVPSLADCEEFADPFLPTTYEPW